MWKFTGFKIGILEAPVPKFLTYLTQTMNIGVGLKMDLKKSLETAPEDLYDLLSSTLQY